MVSSVYHTRCESHLERSKQLCDDLKFDEAARELLEANKYAIHAGDMFFCERQKSRLVHMHGVDWHKALKAFKL